MKKGEATAATVSKKICAITRKRCGATITCTRDVGGVTPFAVASPSMAVGANNENTAVNGNNSLTDVLRGATDFCNDSLAIVVRGDVARMYTLANIAYVTAHNVKIICCRGTNNKMHDKYTQAENNAVQKTVANILLIAMSFILERKGKAILK